MGITLKTPMKEIQVQLDKQRANLENALIMIMDRVGLQFVSDARSSLNIDTGAFPAIHKMTEKEMGTSASQPGIGDYMDQSSNLRSSIGYFVFKNGMQIRENLQGTSEGVSKAKEIITTVPKSGFQLIGVAGMDYASYLEALGFNVITSQAGIAMVNLDEKLRAYAKKKGIDNLGYDFSMSAVLQ